MQKLAISLLAVFAASTTAWGQPIAGSDLALKSSGSDTLSGPGYLGTYIEVTDSGDGGSLVNLTMNANRGFGGSGAMPHMNIVVADSKFGFDLNSTTAANFSTGNFWLPAGTHFVRLERDTPNNPTSSTHAAVVNELNVSGASFDNGDTNTNALDAADTYIDHYRQGSGKLYMPAIQPGTQVHVKLKSHEFNFGSNVPGSSASTYFNNPNFQQFVLDHFNMVVPSNAGKWSNNEGTRDGSISSGMSFVDTILNFAQANDLRARMHALLWGNQQPGWIATGTNGLLNDPTGTDTYSMFGNPQGTNLNSLDAFYSDLLAPAGTPNVGEPSEVHERINYYVLDRASKYVELDTYNESYHTGVNGGSNSIWNRYGPAGVASMFEDTAEAVAAAGSTARLYTNEYSVLENQGGDSYANWYRENIELIQNADDDPSDGPVTGVGIQYYSHGGHSAGLMMKALQNMSTTGLPMTLTEFGVQSSLTDLDDRIRNVTETHRMIFGTPSMEGLLYWGWWDGATSSLESSGTLVDLNWNLTAIGDAWLALRDSWETDLMLNVAGDGTVDFSGFYGDYEITVGSQTVDVSFNKNGDSDILVYQFTQLGDTDGDGDVDIDDLVNVKNNFGSTSAGFAEGDTDGDGDVDSDDLMWVKLFFGSAVTPGPPPGLTFVPEPASLGLLSIGGLMLLRRRRRA